MQNENQRFKVIHKDIFTCLFSIHNIISFSCHEQVKNLENHDHNNKTFLTQAALK